MKTLHIATLATACLLAGSMAWAAETATAPAKADCKACGHCSGGDREARNLAKYDANHDGKLDEAEQATMKAAKAARHAEFIKKYDKNGDGKLDETESAAAKADWAKSHAK